MGIRRSLVLLSQVIAVVLLPLPAMAVPELIWSRIDNNTIREGSADGSGRSNLLSASSMPFGVAVDLTHAKIYWLEGNAIRRADYDGGNSEDVVTGVNAGYSLALDPVGEKIYWTEHSQNKIRSADYDGDNVVDLATGADGVNGPLGIILDPAVGYLYIAEDFGQRISRIQTNGAGYTVLYQDAAIRFTGITLDASTGYLYTNSRSSLYRLKTDGSSFETVRADTLSGALGIDIDVPSGRIFVANQSPTNILALSLDGTTQTILYASENAHDIAVGFIPTPTPTSTPTSTPTATSTATNTPTITSTATPTSTPTSLPTLAPSATPTAVSSATLTPAATPTNVPTATATPSVAATEISGVIRDQNGNPIAGALVYFPRVGTAMTDENGRFSFTNVTFTGAVTLIVKKTGISFAEESFPVEPGQFVVVTGQATSYNPLDCPSKDITAKLNQAARLARRIFELATASTGKLPHHISYGIRRGTSRERLLRRLIQQFDRYLNASRAIPEITVDCSGSQCDRYPHGRALKIMRLELKNLRHGGLFASRALEVGGKQKGFLNRRIRRLTLAARRMVARLPRSTDICT